MGEKCIECEMGDVNGGSFKSFVADLQQAKRLLLTITSCKQARESALPCIYCNGSVWGMEKPSAAIVRLLLEPTTWKRTSQIVIDVFIDFLDYLTSCVSTMAVKCVFKASLKFLIRPHIYVGIAHACILKYFITKEQPINGYWNIVFTLYAQTLIQLIGNSLHLQWEHTIFM